jgi:O-acetyl-ADP-ribose deacetylase (regulator of RNase III)
MITRYIKDSILNTELPFIAHGVNCRNRMGSGVAKVLYEAYPKVKTSYHNFASMYEGNEFHLLGFVKPVYIGEVNKTIFNCFTQLNYGYDGERYVNYKAIADCFDYLTIKLEGKQLAIPRIGCGLAGGDWAFMEQLINDTVGDNLEIWVYDPELKDEKETV